MPRGETNEDRVEAAAYFAAARTSQQRGEVVTAIRLYQRALRRDPNASTIARSIVTLLCELGRNAEAVRYAIKNDSWTADDAILLRRLGVYLTEEGRWKEAIPLYQRALQARGEPKRDSVDLMLAMEMGRLYQLDEQYEKAAAQFDRVLEVTDLGDKSGLDEKFLLVLLGDDGVTYGLIGECCLLTKRPEDALRLFERCHAASPNLGSLEFNRARVLMQQDKPADAIKALDRAFAAQVSGEGLAPYELLAEALLATGRGDSLVARLETLYAGDAKNYPLTFALAQAQLAAGAANKAEPLLVGLMEVRPSPTVFRCLVKLLRESGRVNRLVEVLGATAEKAGVLDFLGAESQTIASDESLLTSLFVAARETLPTEPKQQDFGLASAMAVLAIEGKQYTAAEEFFERAIAARGEKAAEMLLVWGVGLLVDQRYADAAKVFRRCEAADGKGDVSLAKFYLAAALALSGEGDEATEQAEQAHAARPDSPRFAARLGWVYYQDKRFDEAERHYRKLVEQFGANYTVKEGRDAVRDAKFGLSNICSTQGRTAEAEEWLEQVLDEFPNNPAALNDLGYLWADRSAHLAVALRMIQEAVAAEPDNGAFRDSLGWTLLQLGRPGEAIEELKTAAKTQPDGVVLEHLGDAHSKAGQTDQAREAWAAAADWFDRQDKPVRAKTTREKINAAEKGG